ncbi:MAG: hypothetical protein M3Y77_14800 [Actinomycetota bacterium]|nr:hypothetical protein [Actinomycetota bacterium]
MELRFRQLGATDDVDLYHQDLVRQSRRLGGLQSRTSIDSTMGTVMVRDPGDGAQHPVDPGLACDVIAASGRQLVGSVVGLGDKPLPYR